MFSVSRSHAAFHTEIAHIRRIVAQTDWDARPTFCYRLRAALREAVGSLPGAEDIEQRSRAVMRAAEHFVTALRPNFTPATVELMARIDELKTAGDRALETQARDRAQAA
ncbi:MAG TPA: hypothetical protein PKA55_02650 [Rhodoblastus sp.]|nr:hypothetical protein [Rhodoblastus sp.]